MNPTTALHVTLNATTAGGKNLHRIFPFAFISTLITFVAVLLAQKFDISPIDIFQAGQPVKDMALTLVKNVLLLGVVVWAWGFAWIAADKALNDIHHPYSFSNVFSALTGGLVVVLSIVGFLFSSFFVANLLGVRLLNQTQLTASELLHVSGFWLGAVILIALIATMLFSHLILVPVMAALDHKGTLVILSLMWKVTNGKTIPLFLSALLSVPLLAGAWFAFKAIASVDFVTATDLTANGFSDLGPFVYLRFAVASAAAALLLAFVACQHIALARLYFGISSDEEHGTVVLEEQEAARAAIAVQPIQAPASQTMASEPAAPVDVVPVTPQYLFDPAALKPSEKNTLPKQEKAAAPISVEPVQQSVQQPAPPANAQPVADPKRPSAPAAPLASPTPVVKKNLPPAPKRPGL